MLVDGEVVGEPGDPRVHLGAAQRLVVGLLAGGHLHQRRPAEEHLGLAVDQDRVVAHAGHVGAARGRVAEHQRHGRHAWADSSVSSWKIRPAGTNRSAWVGRSAPPDSTRFITGSRLVRAISSARRVLRSEYGFIAPPRTVGSCAMITHSTPEMTPMPVTTVAADGEPGSPGGQRGQLEERAVRVDEQLDPLPGQQPAPVAVPLLVARSAPGTGQRHLLVVLGQEGHEGGPVGLELLARGVDVAREYGHCPWLRRRSRSWR